MSDIAKWKLHGHVHTIRTEFAQWDVTKEEWQPSQSFSIARYLPDGRISETEHHNPDGPVYRTTHSYDSLGRLIRVLRSDPDGVEHVSESRQYEPDGRKTKTYSVPWLPEGTT